MLHDDNYHFCSVYGASGSGKSRLLIEAAHYIAERRRLAPTGRFGSFVWVPFASKSNRSAHTMRFEDFQPVASAFFRFMCMMSNIPCDVPTFSSYSTPRVPRHSLSDEYCSSGAGTTPAGAPLSPAARIAAYIAHCCQWKEAEAIQSVSDLSTRLRQPADSGTRGGACIRLAVKQRVV